MSKPKRQHSIAQMHSKRFADPNGILYVFDRRFPHKGIQKRTPRNLFVERDLYTQVDDDGTKDVSVETEFLARLESEASPVLEKIVTAARRGHPPNLSPVEKDIWVKFSYIQFKRVPETREKFTKELRQDIRREINFIGQFRPFTDIELSILDDEETMERLLRNSSIQSVQMPLSKEGADILLEKRIGVAVIRETEAEAKFRYRKQPSREDVA